MVCFVAAHAAGSYNVHDCKHYSLKYPHCHPVAALLSGRHVLPDCRQRLCGSCSSLTLQQSSEVLLQVTTCIEYISEWQQGPTESGAAGPENSDSLLAWDNIRVTVRGSALCHVLELVYAPCMLLLRVCRCCCFLTWADTGVAAPNS